MAGVTLGASWLAGGPRLSDFFSDVFAQPDYDPAGLAVSMAGQDATLTWYPSPSSEGVTSYDLYRRSPPTGALFVPGSDTPVATGVTSPYVDAALAAGNYEWQVIGNIWTPASLTGASEWWHAPDTSKLTVSGGTASQWTGQLNAKTLTQATSSFQPTSGSVTINGLNAVGFDLVDDEMSNFDVDLTQPFYAFIVAAATSLSVVPRTFFYGVGAGGNAPTLYFDSSLVLGFYGGGSITSSYTLSDTNAHLYEVIYTGSGATTLYVDGASVGSTTGNTLGATGGFGLTQQNAGGAQNPLGHKLGALVFGTGVLPSADRTMMETWSRTTFGTP